MTIEEFIEKHRITMTWERLPQTSFSNRFNCTFSRPINDFLGSRASFTAPTYCLARGACSDIPEVALTLCHVFTESRNAVIPLNYRDWLERQGRTDDAESWREYKRRIAMNDTLFAFCGRGRIWGELADAVRGSRTMTRESPPTARIPFWNVTGPGTPTFRWSPLE